MNILFGSPRENLDMKMEEEVKCLFHPMININNTPIRNMLCNVNDSVNQTHYQGQMGNNNILQNNNTFQINQRQNFSGNHSKIINLTIDDGHVNMNLMENLNSVNTNQFNTIIQTPKSSVKMERELLFSPDDNNTNMPHNLNITKTPSSHYLMNTCSKMYSNTTYNQSNAKPGINLLSKKIRNYYQPERTGAR
jgi:hypothetical protein